MIRVIVPDVHGSYSDPGAIAAFLRDLKFLSPGEIVFLGDMVDAGGMLSVHPRNYTQELEYSYEQDCAAASAFLDSVQKAAPRAELHYLAGNHEDHVERWAARTFMGERDAKGFLRTYAPRAKLSLKSRGIKYYESSEHYMGIGVPGSIRLGKCHFTHGSFVGKHATAAHLDACGVPVVHGHVHRSAAVVRRNVASGIIGAWCPGTLSVLQPLYLHTSVSAWSHGYAIQLVERDGRFLHVNVPITSGKSLLKPLLDQLRHVRPFGRGR
jgi:UDP-2,3-diacylglucosamine pyrophosphatase LpxH